MIDDLRQALYACKIVSYAQGYQLMRAAAADLRLEPQLRRDRADVARRLHHPLGLPGQDQGRLRHTTRTWPTCCSTRSSRRLSSRRQAAWRRVVMAAVQTGIPMPAISTALAYFDGYRTRPPARQPAPGPARLLRRAHLRAHRQAPRRVLPHQLDRPRRRDDVGKLHGVGQIPLSCQAPRA